MLKSLKCANLYVSMMMVGSLCMAKAVLANPPPGPEYVCVRSFAPNLDATEMSDHFVYVKPADRGTGLIYTKLYAASMCETAPKEFKWVQGASGEKICTVDFHQEGVSEYCYSNPKIFSWALKADAE